MSVAGIGDDDDKEMEWYRSCSTGELNGMYLSAARQGDWPRIEKLLEAGAELDYGGGAALTAAVDGGYVDVARKLVALGVNTLLSKQEALSDAVFADRADAVVFLIDEVKADPAFNDSTVLFSAVVNNHAGMTRLLLEKGANVQANAGTLLGIALSRDFEDVAIALLDGGADPRKSFLDKNAYEWAAEKHMRAVSARLRQGPETDVYMSAGFFKRQTLTDLRGKYDERQKQNGICLAAEAGCFDIVRDKFLAASNEKLTRDDLIRGERGRNALKALAEGGDLALAFDPRLWIGRKEEALSLLRDVPPEYRDQADGAALAAGIDRQALKARAKNLSLKLKF